MRDISTLRQQADRWFRFAKVTPDEELRARALSLGRQCCMAAEAEETQRAGTVHGYVPGRDIWRLSPLRRVALVQISRLDRQIEIIEAEAPRDGSARADILGWLRHRRSALLESCGLEPANDRGELS